MNKYPKVLVIGATFNDYTAGGITISNLFKYWPKECIANAYSLINVSDCERVRPCCKYYQFLDNTIKNTFKSISLNKKGEKNVKLLFKDYAFRFLKWINRGIGFDDLKPESRLSKDFFDFIQQFHPDIIYSPMGNLHEMNFIIRIYDITKIPIAIHIWDDWPSGIHQPRWFKTYWIKKYDRVFRQLISISTVNLSICDKMSKVYYERYGIYFTPFHNPVILDEWNFVPNTDFNKKHITILYLGKIIDDTLSSIIEMCSVVHQLNSIGYRIQFDLYSQNCTDNIKRNIERYCGCNLRYSDIPKSKIPFLVKQSSILFLPLSFKSDSVKYTKLSMLTKVSEYLVSKVPILLYCPKETAVYEYLCKTKSAFIADYGLTNLKATLIELINNDIERGRVINNAYKTASQNHNNINICESFRQTLNIIDYGK